MPSLKTMSFLVIGAVIVYFLLFDTAEERLKSYYSRITYHGKVIHKYIDQPNHNYRIILLENGDRVSLPPKVYGLYNKIAVGDILYKESSSLQGLVRSQDKQLVIDYSYAIGEREQRTDRLREADGYRSNVAGL